MAKKQKMRVWTASTNGRYIGAYFVIVAPNAEAALVALQDLHEDTTSKNECDVDDLTEIDITTPNVFVLSDGDY